MSNIKSEKANNTETNNKEVVLSAIYLVLAVIYLISPIDAIPDIVPVLGWMDDALIIVTASLNMIQKTLLKGNVFLENLTKYIKFALIGLLILIVLLFLLLGTTLYAIFS